MKYILIILLLLLPNLTFAENSPKEAIDYIKKMLPGDMQNFTEGVNKKYYKSGALLMDVTIKNKKPVDVAKIYYEGGPLQMEMFFENGQCVHSKTYDIHGKLKIDAVMKDGQSIQSAYDDNQRLQLEQFTKGSKVEKIKTYDANGNVTFEGTQEEYKTEVQNKLQHGSEKAENNLMQIMQDETLSSEDKKELERTLELLKTQKIKVMENFQ